MFIQKLRQFIFKREGKRWPFMAAPLRQAGQSVREELEDAQLSFLLPLIAIPILGLILIFLMVKSCWGDPLDSWQTTGFTYLILWLIFSFGVCLWVRKARHRVASYHLGWLAERVVAEKLEECRQQLTYVFHDIVEETLNGQKFNIDHVAVGEAGIFVFETKARSKPEKGDVTISFDGTKLKFADGSSTDDPIRQVKANARRIHDRLIKLLKDKRNRVFQFHPDRPLPVTPVIVYPGWNIRFQDFQSTDFNVCTEKSLANFINKRQAVLSKAEVRELGQLLEGSLRKERKSILEIENWKK